MTLRLKIVLFTAKQNICYGKRLSRKQTERSRSFTRLNRPKRRTKRRASGGAEDTVCRPRIKRTPPKRRERNGRTFKNSPFFVPHDNLQKRQIYKRKNALSIYKRNKKSHKPQFKTALAKTAENSSREGEFYYLRFLITLPPHRSFRRQQRSFRRQRFSGNRRNPQNPRNCFRRFFYRQSP